MTTKELHKELEKRIKENPSIENDEIYYLNREIELEPVTQINIEWDIDQIGRYVCIS